MLRINTVQDWILCLGQHGVCQARSVAASPGWPQDRSWVLQATCSPLHLALSNPILLILVYCLSQLEIFWIMILPQDRWVLPPDFVRLLSVPSISSSKSRRWGECDATEKSQVSFFRSFNKHSWAPPMCKTLCWVLEPAQSVLVLPEPGRREFSMKAGSSRRPNLVWGSLGRWCLTWDLKSKSADEGELEGGVGRGQVSPAERP